MNWEDAKARLLSNAEVNSAYKRTDLGYEIGSMISDARVEKGLTQSELADLVGTKQPSIARIEKGNYLPSLTFLQKVAYALDTDLLAPRFANSVPNPRSYTIFTDQRSSGIQLPRLRSAHNSYSRSQSESFIFSTIVSPEGLGVTYEKHE